MGSKHKDTDLPANIFELQVCVVGRGGDEYDQFPLELHELSKEVSVHCSLISTKTLHDAAAECTQMSECSCPQLSSGMTHQPAGSTARGCNQQDDRQSCRTPMPMHCSQRCKSSCWHHSCYTGDTARPGIMHLHCPTLLQPTFTTAQANITPHTPSPTHASAVPKDLAPNNSPVCSAMPKLSVGWPCPSSHGLPEGQVLIAQDLPPCTPLCRCCAV
jgi:hypothetical protein